MNDYPTSISACGGTADTNKYLVIGTTEPAFMLFVYNDSGLTSPYDGNNSWHLMYDSASGDTWAVNIGYGGLIQMAVVAC